VASGIVPESLSPYENPPVTAFLIAQFLIYALAWAIAGKLLREDRRAVLWWSAYCVLQAGALRLLMLQPPTWPTAAPPSATLALLAYATADLGIDQFVHGRVRHGRWWTGLLVPGLLSQALVWLGVLPAHLGAATYDFVIAGLLMVPAVALHRPLHREFGGWGLAPLVPGGLVCLLAAVRGSELLLRPESLVAGPQSGLAHNPVLLLVTLAAAGAFNISFLGLVLGRLVLRLHRRLGQDALTGLANRAGLERQLEVAWAASRRHGPPLSIAFIDIDTFKLINDTGGHDEGDRVIREVADALVAGARASDQLGRWGGDEFMVVMPHTDEAAAMQAAARLRERVQAAQIPVPTGCPPLSLSIGIATRQAGDAQLQTLVVRADQEMYRIKRSRHLPRVRAQADLFGDA
jgi:diguanylate cyclase (GGDEF)-like protein